MLPGPSLPPGPSPSPGPSGRPLPPRSPDPSGAEPPPPAVAAALAHLEQLDTRPVAEHVEVLDAVHRLLQDALATLDEV